MIEKNLCTIIQIQRLNIRLFLGYILILLVTFYFSRIFELFFYVFLLAVHCFQKTDNPSPQYKPYTFATVSFSIKLFIETVKFLHVEYGERVLMFLANFQTN